MAQVTLDRPELPYSLNRYYRHLVSNFPDKNVYDTGKVAVGKTDPKMGPSMNSAIAQNTGGALLEAGTYYYIVVGVIGTRETLMSREEEVVVASPNNSVSVTWSLMQGVTGYRIFRSTKSDDYRNCLVGEVGSAVSTFLDNGSPVQMSTPLAYATKFTGTVTPAGLYTVKLMKVKRNDEVDDAIMATVQTKADGTFELSSAIPRGSNKFYALVGSDKSAPVFVNAYNIHLYLQMIATEMMNYWQEYLEQTRADYHLDPTKEIFSNDDRSPSITALEDVWGVLTSVIKPSLYTYDEYLTLIKAVLKAYKGATSIEAIIEILQALFPGWGIANYIPLDVHGYGFRLGRKLKFDVVRAPIGSFWEQRTAAAGFDGRVRHAGVVFNGEMYIMGGTKIGGLLRDVWKSANGTTWTPVTTTAAWGLRTDMAVVVYDGYMWLIGGNNGSSDLNDVWKSNDGANWTQVTASAAFAARGQHAATVFKGQMWISGGGEVTPLSDVWYSNDGIHWMESTASAWPARYGHAMVSFQNKLYAVMGNLGGTEDPNVYQSPDGVTWTLVSTFAQGRSFHTVTVHDNSLYLIGGREGVTTYNDIYVSKDGIIWTLITQTIPLSGRELHVALSYSGQLYVIAGAVLVPASDVQAARIGDPGSEYSWTGGNIAFGGERRYVKAGTDSVVMIGSYRYVYIDGTVDADGYWELKNLEVAMGVPLRPANIPEGALVLACIMHAPPIVHISGQGRLAVSSSLYKGQGSGPFLVGPSYITDRARIRSRGFKYSRFVIYMNGLAMFDIDRNVKIEMAKALLKDVKPAKMTILLGIPPSITFVEI